MANQMLLKREVKTLPHFKSDNSLYTLEQKYKTFPQKIKIGLRRVGYRADEIYSCLESLKVEYRGGINKHNPKRLPDRQISDILERYPNKVA